MPCWRQVDNTLNVRSRNGRPDWIAASKLSLCLIAPPRRPRSSVLFVGFTSTTCAHVYNASKSRQRFWHVPEVATSDQLILSCLSDVVLVYVRRSMRPCPHPALKSALVPNAAVAWRKLWQRRRQGLQMLIRNRKRGLFKGKTSQILDDLKKPNSQAETGYRGGDRRHKKP